MKLKIKDQIPDIEIFHLADGEPQTSKIRDILGNGKIILFGLPGAFTSTCSKLHLPGYVANTDKIKAKEIDKIMGSINEGTLVPKTQVSFDIGEQVKVCEGPFASFSGLVEEVDEEKSRLKVSVSIFGRPTPIDLEYNQVEKY